MTVPRYSGTSDAVVIFGATGDLAFKKLFPALSDMVRRGNLNVPVIGVARSGSIADLRKRAEESIRHHGNYKADVFERLSALLRYVPGDYRDRATFDKL